METRTITCPCGHEVTIKYTNNVGEVKRSSGYTPLSTYTGEFIYLCPGCSTKAIDLAQQLVDIIHNIYFYFPSLLGPNT